MGSFSPDVGGEYANALDVATKMSGLPQILLYKLELIFRGSSAHLGSKKHMVLY